MIMMGIENMGDIPFPSVYLHVSSSSTVRR